MTQTYFKDGPLDRLNHSGRSKVRPLKHEGSNLKQLEQNLSSSKIYYFLVYPNTNVKCNLGTEIGGGGAG